MAVRKNYSHDCQSRILKKRKWDSQNIIILIFCSFRLISALNLPSVSEVAAVTASNDWGKPGGNCGITLYRGGSWAQGHTISSSEPHADLEALTSQPGGAARSICGRFKQLQGAGVQGAAPRTGCDRAMCTAVHKGGTQSPQLNLRRI